MNGHLFDPAPSPRAMRLAFILGRVRSSPTRYRSDFEWLEQSFALWEAFEREAHRVYKLGFRHYAARTLWEVMRHHTALREGPNKMGLKLNDHWPPNLARLYVALYPERDGFFELRESPQRKDAA